MASVHRTVIWPIKGTLFEAFVYTRNSLTKFTFYSLVVTGAIGFLMFTSTPNLERYSKRTIFQFNWKLMHITKLPAFSLGFNFIKLSSMSPVHQNNIFCVRSRTIITRLQTWMQQQRHCTNILEYQKNAQIRARIFQFPVEKPSFSAIWCSRALFFQYGSETNCHKVLFSIN